MYEQVAGSEKIEIPEQSSHVLWFGDDDVTEWPERYLDALSAVRIGDTDHLGRRSAI
jgi:hypothetical protein